MYRQYEKHMYLLIYETKSEEDWDDIIYRMMIDDLLVSIK
jgi:hypothetical protein